MSFQSIDMTFMLIWLDLALILVLAAIFAFKNSKSIKQWFHSNNTKHIAAISFFILAGTAIRVFVTPLKKFVPEGHVGSYFDIIAGSKEAVYQTPVLSILSKFIYLNLSDWLSSAQNNILYLNLFISILSICLVYTIVQLLFHKFIVSLASGFLVMINPLHVFYSIDPYQVIIPFFILLLSITLLIIAVQKKSLLLFYIALALNILSALSRSELFILGTAVLAIFLYFMKPTFLKKKRIIASMIIYLAALCFIFALAETTIFSGDAEGLANSKKTALSINLFDKNAPGNFKIGYLQYNLVFLDPLMPFDKPILFIFAVFCAGWLMLQELKPKKKRFTATPLIISFVAFHLFFTMFNDYDSRHALLQITLLIIVFSVSIVKIFSSKKIIYKVIALGIVCYLLISNIAGLSEVKLRYFATNEDFYKNTVEFKENLPLLNNFCNDFNKTNGYIISEFDYYIRPQGVDTYGSIFFDGCPKNMTKMVHEIIFQIPSLENTAKGNYYILYDSNYFRMSGYYRYFRENKLFRILDTEKIGFYFVEDKYSSIVYKVKGLKPYYKYAAESLLVL